MTGKIAVGKQVPAFASTTTDGKAWKLKDLAGQQLALYFYPRDATPGCSIEAQNFRDLQAAFKKAKTLVIGVSRDSCASHNKFKQKESLNFELLSDEDESLCQLFDVIKEKNMYGKKVLGIERSTFLIGSDGVLRRQWRKVKVEGHAEAVLEAARNS